MRRLIFPPRSNWQSRVEEQGLLFHTDGKVYWDESAGYEFREREILALEEATAELYALCLQAVQHVIDKQLYARFSIPPQFIPALEASWNEDAPSLYGRFDLAYDGKAIKLLEFNADTPTSLLEASVVQWYWLQDTRPSYDQYNSLHESLVACLKSFQLDSSSFHLCCVSDSLEDYMTLAYLADCAAQAGYTPQMLYMEDIGYDDARQVFTGINNEAITTLFKLYPYEWLIHEPFGVHLAQVKPRTQWIEPMWKMILSNKMLLVLLWELFPAHPNLLPTGLEVPQGPYVRKPQLSREGANVQIKQYGQVLAETGGEYGEEGYVYQQYFAIPPHDNKTAVIGSWVVGGLPAGIGIRESDGLITDNLSRFVPHYFF